MQVSDGTREQKILEEATKLMDQWKEELMVRLAEEEGDIVNGVLLPAYMTAGFNFYRYLKQIVEQNGGKTWQESPVKE